MPTVSDRWDDIRALFGSLHRNTGEEQVNSFNRDDMFRLVIVLRDEIPHTNSLHVYAAALAFLVIGKKHPEFITQSDLQLLRTALAKWSSVDDNVKLALTEALAELDQ